MDGLADSKSGDQNVMPYLAVGRARAWKNVAMKHFGKPSDINDHIRKVAPGALACRAPTSSIEVPLRHTGQLGLGATACLVLRSLRPPELPGTGHVRSGILRVRLNLKSETMRATR
jgi:hypothetical protein